MEISSTTQSILICCRVHGFAPYTIKRNKFNQIMIDAKLNWPLCVYYILLMILFISFTEYAFLRYLHSGSSPRSKLIRGLDIHILLAIFVIHTITSMFSIKNTLRVNTYLKKIDVQLNILNGSNQLHSTTARCRITVLLCLALLSMILILNVNFWYQTIITKLQTNNSTLEVSRYDIHENRYYWIPFHVMCSSLPSLYAKCVTTIHRIGLRYRMLNDIICAQIRATDRFDLVATLDRKHLSDSTTRLFAIHDALGEILNRVSSEFGLTLLFLMISTSFHITMCIYSVVAELLGSNDAVFLILQAFWLLSHIIRIIAIVEPCHLIAFEAKRNRSCVSRLLLLNRNDPEIKQFWQKLMIDRVSFSICGLFHVDRSLLTSISASIATFLVIVFQFEH